MSGASAVLLRKLAEDGLHGVPVDQFPDVAAECDACARATGDARFPVIAQVLVEVFNWWDELGGVPRRIADDINTIVVAELPPALEATTASEGYARAVNFAEAVRPRMTGTSQWLAD